MKKIIFCVFLVLSLNAFSQECRVAKTTKLRLFDDVIQAGDLAVLDSGQAVGLKEILRDSMIHFQKADGSISTAYQWLYRPLVKVEKTKYVARNSYGEDVTVTVDEVDAAGMTTITYVGSGSKNFLTLKCLL